MKKPAEIGRRWYGGFESIAGKKEQVIEAEPDKPTWLPRFELVKREKSGERYV